VTIAAWTRVCSSQGCATNVPEVASSNSFFPQLLFPFSS
jgi:hypothetical protein